MVHGTIAGMQPGTILRREGVGTTVEEMGSTVRNLNIGDRVVSSSAIARG